jgi:hypothetical protein
LWEKKRGRDVAGGQELLPLRELKGRINNLAFSPDGKRLAIASAGRDHWSHCYSVLLAGGGIPPGRVVGSSDHFAAYPTAEAMDPWDVAATWASIPPTTSRTRLAARGSFLLARSCRRYCNANQEPSSDVHSAR